jgi:hypothetical protein
MAERAQTHTDPAIFERATEVAGGLGFQDILKIIKIRSFLHEIDDFLDRRGFLALFQWTCLVDLSQSDFNSHLWCR